MVKRTPSEGKIQDLTPARALFIEISKAAECPGANCRLLAMGHEIINTGTVLDATTTEFVRELIACALKQQ